jgi:hypothetical protein
MIVKNKIRFKSNIFTLWVLAVSAAFILLPFIKSYVPSFTELIVAVLSIYITGIITLRQLVFKENIIEIRNVLYPFNHTVVKTIRYSEVFAVEIRDISAPYQQPYIILHYTERDLNSRWFTLRSGNFKRSDDLTKLEVCLKEKEVRTIWTY